MTVGEYKGRKVQEVKKLIQKLLIGRVMSHKLLIGREMFYVLLIGQMMFHKLLIGWVMFRMLLIGWVMLLADWLGNEWVCRFLTAH